MVSYLSVRSKFPIQSYVQRVNESIKKMGVTFLPPGVKESGREANSDLVIHAKGKEDLIPIERLWRLPSPH